MVLALYAASRSQWTEGEGRGADLWVESAQRIAQPVASEPLVTAKSLARVRRCDLLCVEVVAVAVPPGAIDPADQAAGPCVPSVLGAGAGASAAKGIRGDFASGR